MLEQIGNQSTPSDDDPRSPPLSRGCLLAVVAGFGESGADFQAEVVEVERLTLGGRFAAGLTLGLFGRTGRR